MFSQQFFYTQNVCGKIFSLQFSIFVYGWYYYHTCRQMLLPYFTKHTLFVADVIALADVIAMFCVLFLLLRLMFLPHY